MTYVYSRHMTDSDDSDITSGWLLQYGSSTFFRPSDGRYDGIGGDVNEYYGFGSCNYDDQENCIRMNYNGGTPYQPSYIFTETLGPQSTATGHVASIQDYRNQINFTDQDQFDEINVSNIRSITVDCVYLPSFKVATHQDARDIGGRGTGNNKAIIKSELSTYNVGLKTSNCVIEPEEYTSDQCLLKDDIVQLVKYSLTIDYRLAQECVTIQGHQTCYDSGSYNKIRIKITTPSGVIFYYVIQSLRDGDYNVIDLSGKTASQIAASTITDIPANSEIIIDCAQSEATYGSSPKRSTVFLGFKMNGNNQFASQSYTYRFIIKQNSTATLCFTSEIAPFVMVEGTSMAGTTRQEAEQSDDIDYFYIKANENNLSPVYLWLLKYKFGKRNYDYITNVSPNLEYSTDKITWTQWPTITQFLNIPWNETSLGPDLGNNSHRLQFGSWSSADKNAFETNVISNGGIILNPGVKLYLRGNNPGGFNSKSYQWSFTQSFRPIFTTIQNIGRYIYVAPDDSSNNNTFTLRSNVSIGGNIMTLIDITGNITEIPNEYCFTRLFAGTESDEILQTQQGFKYVKDPTRIIPDLRLTQIADNTLSATSLKEHCYDSMFDRCHTLTSAGLLPAETLVRDCYYKMYSYCTKLTSIKCNAVTRLDHYYSYLWVDQLPNSGTFYYHNGIDWSNKRNKSSIPSGWTATPLS